MRTIRRSIAAALGVSLSLIGATSAWGQGAAHKDVAPHGGEIIAVGAHHVEFKADSTGLIQVWMLDGKQKTVVPPAGATVTLVGTGGTQVTLPLQVPTGAEPLTARYDHGKFRSFQAIVKLPVDGKSRNFRFRYPH